MGRKRKKPKAVKVRRVMPPPEKVHPSKRRKMLEHLMDITRRLGLYD